MDKQELFRKAKEAILDVDETKAIDLVYEAKKSEIDLLELLLSGFGAGNDEIGEQFDKGSLSLPELMYAAEVMKTVTNTILELLQEDGSDTSVLGSKGKILLATVEGDVHDIGKGIVASTLKAGGFEVIDLGMDVEPEDIVEAVEENPDTVILGLSAMLTTTMYAMKDTIEALEEAGLRDKLKIMIGGGREKL